MNPSEIPDWCSGPHLKEQLQMVEGFRLILSSLGLDTSLPHLRETPSRAAKAWWKELCRGLTQDPPIITTFESDSTSMILLRDIPVHSLCAHHLLPFLGKASIAYVPGNGKILGLSKLSRITSYWARRPQVQEDLTEQIANHVAQLVMSPKKGEANQGGVGVMIRANHMCMEIRGVNHPGDMVTSALRGVFLTKPEARAEFLSLTGAV